MKPFTSTTSVHVDLEFYVRVKNAKVESNLYIS